MRERLVSARGLQPLLCLCLSLATRTLAQFTDIDNGIKGLPTVTCGENDINFRVETNGAFAGNLYTKGFFDSEKCRVKGWQSRSSTTNITVPVGPDCGTRRTRTMSPRGIMLEVTVVVMFHRLFLTKVDKSFRVECFYVQYDKHVSQSFDVSVPTDIDLPSGPLLNSRDEGGAIHPGGVSATPKTPSCTYEVLLGGPTGPPLKYAKLGDVVFHRWKCADAAENMCMTVHTCVVDDGQGQGQELLDDRGCTNDAFLLENLVYKSQVEAFQRSQVFRFADKPTVFFSCQIRLETVEEEGMNCTHRWDRCGPPKLDGSKEVVVPIRPQSTVIEQNFPKPPPLNEQLGPTTIGNVTETFPKPTPLESTPGYPENLEQPEYEYVDTAQEVQEPPNETDEEIEEEEEEEDDGRARMRLQRPPLVKRDYEHTRNYVSGTAGLAKPILRMIDLMEPSNYEIMRKARSVGEGSLDIDVRAPAMEVSDAPLFDVSDSQASFEHDVIRIAAPGEEVCMSTVGFAALLSSMVLTICIVSTLYWIHAFRRTGQLNRFLDAYWDEAPQLKPA